MHHQNSFLTGSGLLGICHEAVETGVFLCIYYGGNVLYIQRDRTDGRYDFLGLCYVESVTSDEMIHALGR